MTNSEHIMLLLSVIYSALAIVAVLTLAGVLLWGIKKAERIAYEELKKTEKNGDDSQEEGQQNADS